MLPRPCFSAATPSSKLRHADLAPTHPGALFYEQGYVAPLRTGVPSAGTPTRRRAGKSFRGQPEPVDGSPSGNRGGCAPSAEGGRGATATARAARVRVPSYSKSPPFQPRRRRSGNEVAGRPGGPLKTPARPMRTEPPWGSRKVAAASGRTPLPVSLPRPACRAPRTLQGRRNLQAPDLNPTTRLAAASRRRRGCGRIEVARDANVRRKFGCAALPPHIHRGSAPYPGP